MTDAPEMIDGRFELLQKLGEGGMGSVYRAHQRGVDRMVALKLLKSGLVHSPEQQRRFRTEAKAISILDHPNIVAIYATGTKTANKLKVVALLVSTVAAVISIVFVQLARDSSVQVETLEQARADFREGARLDRSQKYIEAYEALKRATTCPDLADDPLLMVDLGVQCWTTASHIVRLKEHEPKSDELFAPGLTVLSKSVPLLESRVAKGTINPEHHQRAMVALFYGHACLAHHYRRSGKRPLAYQHENKMFEYLDSGITDKEITKHANQYCRDSLILALRIKDRERALLLARRLFDLQRSAGQPFDAMEQSFKQTERYVKLDDPRVKQISSEVHSLLRTYQMK